MSGTRMARSKIAAKEQRIHAGLIQAVPDSLHVVFLATVPFLVVSFLLTLLIREVSLRMRAGSALGEGLGLDDSAGTVGTIDEVTAARPASA
jgi:hypothetical protein